MRHAVAIASIFGAACAGRYPQPAPTPATGLDVAALGYAVVDGRTGRAVDEATFWTAVGAARAVCLGEEHPNPHHHWAQLAIVRRLIDGGGRRALGLEMVQGSLQGIVDDLATGAIDEPTFVSRVGWETRWGFPWPLYQPIVAAARGAGWELRALNADAELVKRVARAGLAGLTEVERAALPELVLDDAGHRTWFDGIMRGLAGHGGGHGGGHGHGGAGPRPDDIYAAQVVRDEAMAAGAATWLGGGAGAIAILAGNGHCHDGAIPGRLRRRAVAPVVSVRFVVDDGDGGVAAAVTEASVDYLWIMTPPPAPSEPAAAAESTDER